MTLQQWLRVLVFHAVRLGWPGALGLVLLFAAAALLLFNARPREADMFELDRRLANAEKEFRRVAQGAGDDPDSQTPAEHLARFYQGIPAEAAIPIWLEKIYGLAGAAGLSLETGEYALVRAKTGQLNLYRITFPVKGAYPGLRRFIAEVLASAPAIALENVSLKRENVGQGTVESRVVFLLYVGTAS